MFSHRPRAKVVIIKLRQGVVRQGGVWSLSLGGRSDWNCWEELPFGAGAKQ